MNPRRRRHARQRRKHERFCQALELMVRRELGEALKAGVQPVTVITARVRLVNDFTVTREP